MSQSSINEKKYIYSTEILKKVVSSGTEMRRWIDRWLNDGWMARWIGT